MAILFSKSPDPQIKIINPTILKSDKSWFKIKFSNPKIAPNNPIIPLIQ